MREREEIEKDGTRIDILQLEVLLDIRQLLQELKRGKKIKKEGTPRKRGRPRKPRVCVREKK